MIEYDTKHWSGILFRLHGSVLPRITGRVVIVVVVAALLTYAELSLGWELPTSRSLHTIVGVALGLLLVFRTNSSYDRFWEGRIQIGAMVNNTRDLARQTASYLADSPREIRERIGHYIIALFAVIRRSLRREREAPELVELLTEEERERLLHTSAPPLMVARWLSDAYAAEAKAGRLSEERLRMIDGGVSDLIDLWGGSERILKTPVPFAYAHHIKGFLNVFCLTVPMALIDTMGWYTPAVPLWGAGTTRSRSSSRMSETLWAMVSPMPSMGRSFAS